MKKRLNTTDEGWSVAVEHARIGYIHIDFRLGLDIADDYGVVRLTIESACQLFVADSVTTVTPGDMTTLAPALSLFEAEVEAIRIRNDGTLTLEFANGNRLIVCRDESYEAWQVASGNEFLIVCAPGGSVTVFAEDSKT